ncbi:hypothetical protein HGA34_04350 [Candidatus Falkowbacteria bacterium]|nr:hypothetical protein [Candidatus Falkowbacteria bacterium]
MSRKLTESEVEIIRNADLSLRVESAIRKQWKIMKPPGSSSIAVTVSAQLVLPVVSSVYALNAFWPGRLPAVLDSIAEILLMLFMLVVSALLLLASTLTAKQPLNLGAISLMSKKRTWKFYFARVLWLVLFASLVWSGKTLVCLLVVLFWFNCKHSIRTCQKSTRKIMVEIDNDPDPVMIELN